MHEIGRITRVQVQRSGLVIEKGAESYYDPEPLVTVESLLLSPVGVIGVTAAGRQVMDIHHEHHPETRNTKGINGLSLGFTSHYKAMRARFGEKLVDGIAGENIIIESDSIQTLGDLSPRLAIVNQDGQALVYLTGLCVATPCIEFSLFAANNGLPMPAAELKATLQFLNGGMRGFYARVEDMREEVTVAVGDRLFVVDAFQ